MRTVVYLLAAALLVGAAFAVFRVVVRREYQRKTRLPLGTGLLEMLVIDLYLSFPFLYNPPRWVAFWSRAVPVSQPLRMAAVLCVAVGLLSAFGTMFSFGLRRAFGAQVEGLVQSGPYRVTRNPQLVGFACVVLGMAMLWPSWYAVGWVALYGVIVHLMVRTEEEHLLRVFGEEYARYCRRVPRYVGSRWWRQKAAA